MKLSEYIKNLKNVLDKEGDIDVIYASDDEGNRFDEVHNEPSIGIYDTDEREFTQMSDNTKKVICIN